MGAIGRGKRISPVQKKVKKIIEQKKKSYEDLFIERRAELLTALNGAGTNTQKIEILKRGVMWLSEVVLALIKKER